METPKPSITNCPFTFLTGWLIYTSGFRKYCLYMRYSGDYGTKVPPLPIPNREVKLRHADGTAQVGE